jgi:voltage-gated potassium channel
VLRRIKLILLSVAFVFVTGILGFVYLENYPWFDAFYMTLTTVATIGYGEIHPLSARGRVFNSFLIVIGVGLMFQAAGLVAQLVLERELGEVLEKRKSKKMIEQLNDHFIICGFGRVGRGAALEMQRSEVPFVVVDLNEGKVERAMKMGMLAVLADCTRDATLRDLHVEKARGIVTALTSDADNMFLIMSAKTLNQKLVIAARVNEEEAEQKLKRAGADVVFAPYYLTGHRLAQSVMKPHVQEFIDIFTRNIGLSASMEQVQVQPSCEIAGKTLKELQLRQQTGVIVLGIRRGGGSMEFNPPADAAVQSGDYLIVMGEETALRKLEVFLEGESS